MRLVKHDLRRQTRYAQTIAIALKTSRVRHTLAPACIAIMKWTIIGDERWALAIHAVFEALSESDESFRLQSWLALRSRSEDLHLGAGLSHDTIVHLLKPIEPELSASVIKDFLPFQSIERWSEEVKLLDDPTATDIDRLLTNVNGSGPLPTRKRKWGDDEAGNEIRNLLRERVPELAVEEVKGDIMSALLTALEK